MRTSRSVARIAATTLASVAVVGMSIAGLSTAQASDVTGVTEIPAAAATTTSKPAPAPSPAPVQSVAEKAVDFAKLQLGNPFKADAFGWNEWGSMGLVWTAYKQSGHDLGTKDAYSLWNAGKRFAHDKRQTGDIILYQLNGVAHPALISTDTNKLITSYPGKGVIEVPIFESLKNQRVIRPTVKP